MTNILKAQYFGRKLVLRCGLDLVRRYSTAPKAALQKYQPGIVIHGYQVEKVQEVPELYLTAIKLTHLKTGAQHLHVARDDTNNVFSVGFRTTPMDNSGVSHILEHTVLCGSQKFPCRDPFFKMLNRSLSTFMNAWTASDYTMYPFSTQNAQDFQNLLSVYLDAVFFPNLNYLDFLQEGWRLEHQSNEDKESLINFKGVVFNEMKGAMASPEHLYAVNCQNMLLPSHTYSYNSGGNPNDILDLTYEQLKDFHTSHYHPSNSRFYTYGDMPLEGHLELINGLALQNFQKIEADTSIPDESKWTEKRSAIVNCPPDVMAPDPDKQTTVSVTFLLPRITEVQESFDISLLSSLLMSGPMSPFYQALLDANIGAGYSPVCGYDGSTREASFSVGLQGISLKDENKVNDIIKSTLEKVIRDGFDSDHIEAVLHSVELSQRHQTTSFGLGLISSLMPVWNQDGDPISSMELDKLVASFKKKLSDNPMYLQELVKKYLMNNQHQLWLRMTADENYKKKQEKEEAEKLENRIKSLDEDNKKEVYETGLKLASAQNQEVDVNCLPTITIGDIDTKTKRTSIKTDCLHGNFIQLHEQSTNGVTYFRAISPLMPENQDLAAYLPLFCNVITQMGTKNMTFRELAKQEELRTGGLGVTPHIVQHLNNTSYELGILFSSHCLDRNVNEMLHLWQDIFQSVTLSDQERLTTLVRMEAAELANSVAFMGHAFAMKGAASSLSPVGHIGEVTGGMSQVNLMKQIAELDDLSDVVSKLTQLSIVLLNRSNMRFCLNAAPSALSPATKALDSLLTKLPGQPPGNRALSLATAMKYTQDVNFSAVSSHRHFQLPFPVNYVSMGTTAVPYKHEDFTKLVVLARLLSAKFLHREIREKGGAYGGGATMSNDGTFKFYSYRDPHSIETLQVFHQSLLWIQEQTFTNQDLDEAKIAVFSNVDAPIAPGSRGVSTFINGVTDDDRQIQRDQLFAVSRNDVIDVAQRYINTDTRNNSVSLIGPENEFTKQQDKWTIVQ